MTITPQELELREKLSMALIGLLKTDYLYAIFFQSFNRKIVSNLGFKGCAFIKNAIPTIVISAEALENDSITNIQGVLRHEAWHLILEHPQRTASLIKTGLRKGYSRETVIRSIQLAADLVVNQLVPNKEKYGFEVEIDAFGFPHNLTLEEYTKLMLERLKDVEVNMNNNPDYDHTGDPDIDVNIEGNSKMTEKQEEIASRQIKERILQEIYIKEEKERNEEDPSSDSKNSLANTSVGNTSGSCQAELNPDSMEAIQWKVIINNLLMDAKSAGVKIPEEMNPSQFKQEDKHRKIDAVSMLNRYATASIRFNKRKPSRRFSVPPKSELKLANDYSLVVAIDTSGSLWGSDWLERFFRTAVDLWERGIKIYLIQCDATIKYAGELTEDSVKGLVRCGGGGTCFAPIFQHVKDKELQPKAIMFLTDGMNFDEEEGFAAANRLKSTKIIWLISDNGIIPESNGLKYPGDFYIAGVDFD